jgi:hypothetical protein
MRRLRRLKNYSSSGLTLVFMKLMQKLSKYHRKIRGNEK